MAGTWIVMSGSLLDTGDGGGLELCGPFPTEAQAKRYSQWIKSREPEINVCLAIELLSPSKENECDSQIERRDRVRNGALIAALTIYIMETWQRS
jgi:hypothetical protein